MARRRSKSRTVTPNAGRMTTSSARTEIELAPPVVGPVQRLHPHGAELVVDVWVVDDLADEENAAVGELGARLVGVFHGAVHAVAEPELPRQPEREIADGERVAGSPHGVHDPAVVIAGEGALDGALQPEALAEVGLLHGVNLTGRRPRRGRRRAPAGRSSHRETSPASPPALRRRWCARGRAPGARTTGPTCC